MTSSCCDVLYATLPSSPFDFIASADEEWIGFAQGSGIPVIKVNLKLFAGVCLELILHTTIGSFKLKRHKNTTHGTCAERTRG